MKLARFLLGDRPATGIWREDDTLVDVSAFGDVVRLLVDAEARASAARYAARVAMGIPLDSVRLLPPLQPRLILCIGLNYRDHAEETGAPLPTRPIVFAKLANAVAGPNEVIRWRAAVTQQVDYEAELGVVIGATCRDVSPREALRCVGGYTCVNDLSARDLQFGDVGKQWTLGKTLDGFCPIGPCVTLAEAVGDPQALTITCHLNGELMQSASTAAMIFDVATLVAHLSRYITLQPGDLIATGTPAGVGMSRKPPRWLRDGDTCAVTISGIGTLTNTMRVLAD
ncbi:MAG: fumarylacetoacetate hydrolase family protein [Anaerolineae bacterium]|nr:fumarylacetoacetate hydrolase family protein [Anaerolineae bacterium]